MGIDVLTVYITNGYWKVQHLEEIDVDMGEKKMSRLIDADETKRAFVGNRYGTKAIEYVIDNVPTVEAIPIEWILKRAKLCTADYANCLHYAVEAWQTEQKYMVNGQWKFPKE